MNQRTSALIVAPPGPLREALRAALNALPCLKTVSEADSATHALLMVPDPALVLLSLEGSDNNHLAAIRKIKMRWPAAPFIVLVNNVAQQQAAQAAGAKEALIKGIRPADLLDRIEGLLGDRQSTACEGDPLDTGGNGRRT